MNLSDQSKTELHWWTGNINSSWCPITHGEHEIVLKSDSSLRGWGGGGYYKTTNTAIGGQWTPDEKASKHINALELKAAYLTLQSFCANMTNTHVRLMLDNITAVAYIREMGGQ